MTDQTKSTEKWSPTPWTFKEFTSGYGNTVTIEIEAADGTTVFLSHFDLSIPNAQFHLDKFKANADRIVECVNFCAGIPTDDLKVLKSLRDSNTLTMTVQKQQTTIAQLTAENQALKKELHVYHVSAAQDEGKEDLISKLALNYDKEFTIHHPDGTTEKILAPVYKDSVGDECLTAEAIYKINFHKAKYRLENVGMTVQSLRAQLANAQEAVEKISTAIQRLGEQSMDGPIYFMADTTKDPEAFKRWKDLNNALQLGRTIIEKENGR